jgi:hypothetical protein
MKGKGHWQLLFVIAALCMLFLTSFVAAAIATDPPPWEPKFPPQTNTMPDGNTNTISMEKREYTKEDGTKVSEERMIQVIRDKDGKILYVIVNSWITEEKGTRRLNVRTRVREDNKGKRDTWEQRDDTYEIPELPGCTITDSYTYLNDKLINSGCMKSWDIWPPKEPAKPADKEPVKLAAKEKEDVKPDQQGNRRKRPVIDA